jgi:hypothetical protein
MKQTAVEWLVEQLVELDKQLDGRRKNDDATVLKLNPTKLFEQAKEMEKEQMIDFARNIIIDATCSVEGYVTTEKDIEEYYNETFKTNEK